MRPLVMMSVVTALTLLHAEPIDDALAGFDESPSGTKQTGLSSDDALAGFDDTSDTPTSQTASADDALAGFDDAEGKGGSQDVTQIDDANCTMCQSDIAPPEQAAFWSDLSGYVKQQAVYSYLGDAPHDGVTSLRSTLFVDFEHKFDNGWKLKTNARAFYDGVYDLRDQPYTQQECKALHSEVELFDAYLEGSITEKLDFRIGRQVVVWGRSDTIRITDVLNPIDNRQPGMVDIEDLRLPVAMAKFDYYVGSWRVTPIVILEQRFTKDPPFGSQFNPSAIPLPAEEKPHDPTYALSVGGEFSGWDVNFYAARLYDDSKFIVDPLGLNALIKHRKTNMYGAAMNYLNGSWLIKGEAAYFDTLHYTMAPNKTLARLDALVGVEYNGIADTMISYDLSVRHFTSYDARLGLSSITAPGGRQVRLIPVERDTWQQAFRVRSDLWNDTLHANYLISLFGKRADEGGFQRLWADYDINDDWKATVGVVDYIGGSTLFDYVKDDDLLFAEIRYSF